jgi:site-specific recombinase XerD
MLPLYPFHEFLKYRLLDMGVTLTKDTWETYGRRLWDYVRFLLDNNIEWKYEDGPNGEGPVLKYQSWSLFERNISRTTYNKRIGLVADFYKWAFKNKLIKNIPFEFHEVRGANLYLGRERNVHESPNVFVPEWLSPPEFLTKEQIQTCLRQRMPQGTRLLFLLMQKTGLRSCEARTFPAKYVFNPAIRKDCHVNRIIRIEINPRDMHIKYSKKRSIDVSYKLMCELYAYKCLERNRLIKKTDKTDASELILNSRGHPFSKGGVVDAFKLISNKAGFRCRPLMLRHSYAIATLAMLRSRPDFEGEPLLYVRDRMGHEDVQTTAVYLKQLNQLNGSLVMALEDEYDKIFSLS